MDDRGRERLSRIESKRKQRESISKGGSGNIIGRLVYVFTSKSLPSIIEIVLYFFYK